MIAHIYRKGEEDTEGLHVETTRVTVFQDSTALRFREDGKPVLVLGAPQLQVIAMDEIRWYWVEED
jgi:hypothetical protein